MIPACDQKHCTPPTTTACAVMMRSGYNNGGLLGVSRCSVFVMNSLILLEYTDCFLWYLMFVSNFGMCYICTVSYRIVLRAYRDTYRSLCIGDIPAYRFSPISMPWVRYLLWICPQQCSGLSWKSCQSLTEFWEIQTLICKEMRKKFLVLTKSCRSRTDGLALVSNTGP